MSGGRWDGVLDVLAAAEDLKRLRRQGWVDRGVDDPESVADHSYRMAMMVLLLAPEEPVDRARALILALVHDLPEAVAGDATPFDQELAEGLVDRADIFRRHPSYSEEAERAKYAAESAAIAQITARLPPALATLIRGAWEEYEAGQTPEARFVRQIDKLETWLQALGYRQRQPDLVVESFRRGTNAAVTDPVLRDLLAAINARFGVEGE